jgi:hypothetical protein
MLSETILKLSEDNVKTKSKKKDRLCAARFDADDARRIQEIAERLGLKVADVIRRATRVGLGAFENAKLPGRTDDA